MVKPFQCPNARRSSRGLAKFMMCEAMMEREKYSYEKIEECVRAICPHGYYCVASGRWEVSLDAKRKCRILNSANGGTGNG